METITIFIVGYEPLPPNGVGGFDWFKNKEDADNKFSEESKKPGYNVYRGELEIDSETNDETTRKVEMFLDANDWENAFK